ncbi:hypothetical protein GCM10007893_25090 [Paracoccus marinus]|nr:hypothetical protein GCM10007893_25090 [Paracoccus marinus]
MRCFPVQSDAGGTWCRIHIVQRDYSVVGRTRVWVRLLYGANGGVVQVKYTNQVTAMQWRE